VKNDSRAGCSKIFLTRRWKSSRPTRIFLDTRGFELFAATTSEEDFQQPAYAKYDHAATRYELIPPYCSDRREIVLQKRKIYMKSSCFGPKAFNFTAVADYFQKTLYRNEAWKLSRATKVSEAHNVLKSL
jgi:hypothetical protein